MPAEIFLFIYYFIYRGRKRGKGEGKQGWKEGGGRGNKPHFPKDLEIKTHSVIANTQGIPQKQGYVSVNANW